MTSTSSLSESSDPLFFPLPCFFFLLGINGEGGGLRQKKKRDVQREVSREGEMAHFFGDSFSEDRLMEDSSVSDAMNSSMLSSSKKPCGEGKKAHQLAQ